MTSARKVRAAVIGLVSLAAAEEQMLLAAASPADATRQGALARAVALNPDLHANAARDPDLRQLRDGGRPG